MIARGLFRLCASPYLRTSVRHIFNVCTVRLKHTMTDFRKHHKLDQDTQTDDKTFRTIIDKNEREVLEKVLILDILLRSLPKDQTVYIKTLQEDFQSRFAIMFQTYLQSILESNPRTMVPIFYFLHKKDFKLKNSSGIFKRVLVKKFLFKREYVDSILLASAGNIGALLDTALSTIKCDPDQPQPVMIDEIFDAINKINSMKAAYDEIDNIIFDLLTRATRKTEMLLIAKLLTGQEETRMTKPVFASLMAKAIENCAEYNPNQESHDAIKSKIEAYLKASTSSQSFEQLMDYIIENKQVPPLPSANQQVHQAQSVDINENTFVKPMLADAAKSIDKVIQNKNNLTYEYKYDGFRCQVIYTKDEGLQLKSRNGKSFKRDFNIIKEAVMSVIKGANIEKIIIDGEIVPVDKSGRYSAFQEVSKIETGDLVKLVCWDLLQLGDKIYTKEPLSTRRRDLEKVLTTSQHQNIGMTQYINQTTNDIQQAQDFFKKSLTDNCEGLIIKDLDGIYEPGKRIWLKYKKEYDSNYL
ncbi:DNA ligase [Acrasis kona]|uniref:DNA ligase n=1 Tax=Acrasis kona TaxID=1008807 RepID=A0AAW2ZER9_9EUKA